jgi:gas vesicle protein
MEVFMNIDLKGNSSYTKGMVVGALIGGAVSGVAALLFAPKKGTELRRDIADKTEETYHTLAKGAGALAHDAASKVGSFVDKLQTRNEGKTEAGNGMSLASEKGASSSSGNHSSAKSSHSAQTNS